MVGRTLNHYKIISQLGAGGMGEVYLAEDTSLDRQVALKVLPSDLASDPERRQRFEREAKAIAALDHPNIVVVHSVEESDTDEGDHVHFITMQLVEGKTLSELIPRNGFPLEKYFDLAIPLADAISAAHENGIVHRDLKPANIMVSDDGRVRVLDFGLAKLKEEAAGVEGESALPTVGEVEPLTEEGKILGTVAYMSPEQAEGKPVDHRTDIFSLGIILYEMATGERPFKGDTKVSIMSSIVKETPTSVTELNRNLPRHLGRIVKHSLEKDVTRRYQTTLDLRNDLEELKGEIVSGELVAGAAVAAASRPFWYRAIPWCGGVAVGAVVAGLAVWSLMRPAPPAPLPVTRFQIGVEPGHQLRFANPAQQITDTDIAFSPDGRHLVYAATDGERAQLYLRPVNQERATPIRDTEGAWCPCFFSPDGQWIGYFARDEAGWRLMRAPLGGGEARTIASELQPPFGASWGDDDTIVFAVGEAGGLLRVSAAGGTPATLTEVDWESGETSHRLPHFLPGGNAVLFTVMKGPWRWDKAEIVVQSLETGERTSLVQRGADPRYVRSTGHLVFVREGTLMAIPFDPMRLEVAGEPVSIREDVMQACYLPGTSLDTGAAQFSLSASGSLAYVPGGVFPEPERQLVWVDRQGDYEVIPAPPGDYMYPRVSPDGRYLAYSKGLVGQSGVWIYDIQRETPRRLGFEGDNGPIVWSPDGEQIVFSSTKDGSAYNLYLMATGGGEEPERLTRSDRDLDVSSWSRDGVLALVKSEVDIWVLPMEGEGAGEPQSFLDSPFTERAPAFSPDGRWLAYASDNTDRFEVYVRPYPGPGAPIRISIEGGDRPAWSRDGRELFYQGPPASRMMVVDVDATADGELTPGRPRLLFEGRYRASNPTRSYDVTSDSRFVMLSIAQAEPQPVTQINIVLNWFEELKRLVPREQ